MNLQNFLDYAIVFMLNRKYLMSKSDDRVLLHEESPCSIGQDAG